MSSSEILLYHIAINIVFLTVLLIRYGFNVGVFLSMMYTLTAVCSFYYSETPLFYNSYSNQEITIDSLIYLNLINFMLILPFRNFKIESKMKISTFNLGKIRILLTYVLIANALFIILDFPQAIEGLFSSNLKDLRDSTYVEFELPWWNNPVLGILKRLTTAFDPILLFLSVFGFVYDREKKIYKFGMIIYVLNIIKLMGLLGSRGAISFFLIDCILLYILFYPLLSTVVRKKILLIALLCSFGFGSFISAMTYARFTDSNTSSEAVNEAISSSMLLYLGESGINFMGSMYEKESTLLYGYDMFPLFRRLLGLEYIGSDREKATIYFEQATNTRAFIFYQLTGSLYSNFGKYGTFLILLFFNIYLNRLVTRKKNFSIISFLSIFFYSSIIAKGVFYYALKTEGGNLSYVLILTLFLYFIKEKIKNGKKSENLIKNIGLK